MCCGRNTCVGNEVIIIVALDSQILYLIFLTQRRVDNYVLWEEDFFFKGGDYSCCSCYSNNIFQLSTTTKH